MLTVSRPSAPVYPEVGVNHQDSPRTTGSAKIFLKAGHKPSPLHILAQDTSCLCVACARSRVLGTETMGKTPMKKKKTNTPPPLRILQEQHGGPGAPDPDPSIPPSISIIYRSRDRFAFAQHHNTLATDPGGSGVGSASKMSPAPMDPLRLAALGQPQGVGSASKMSLAAMDPLRVTALGQPQGVGSASKTSLPPPDPLALVEVPDAPRAGSPSKRSPASGRLAFKKSFVRG